MPCAIISYWNAGPKFGADGWVVVAHSGKGKDQDFPSHQRTHTHLSEHQSANNRHRSVQSLFVFCFWNALISASLLTYFIEDNRFTAHFFHGFEIAFQNVPIFPRISKQPFFYQEYWIIFPGALFFILFSLDFTIAVNKW